MGKTLKTTCKMCRREGVSLCGKERCAFKRRPFPPGQHGPLQKSPKLSGYGLQLREKQKAKRLYGVMERQFRRYFENARSKTGNTSEHLVRELELRLDNTVYRLGFAKTRRQARQMVNHGFFTVKGKTVDIPSFSVRVGDEIAIKEIKLKKKNIQGLVEQISKNQAPKWLNATPADLRGKVVSLPEGEDLQSVFDSTLIVELYSR
ncbi:MAG: 30S ribosomal protein S4 [Candidatus Uhrbacteria bacterium]